MSNYARIINNVAVDVCTDPSQTFHPTIAAQFVTVPDQVAIGWIKTGSNWAAPSPPPTPVPVLPFLTPVQFKMCFTPAERVQINAIKTTDNVLIVAFEILDDPRLTQVDLTLKSTQDMIDYIVTLGIISASRALEIKAGIIK